MASLPSSAAENARWDDPLPDAGGWSLLDDPVAVLSNRARWPSELSYAMMESARVKWATQQLDTRQGGPRRETNWWAQVAEQHLALLGAQAIERFLSDPAVTEYLWGVSPDAAREALKLAEFPGFETAPFIIHAQAADAECTLFFLADVAVDPVDESQGILVPASVKFRIVGDPLEPSVVALCRNAKAWWGTFGHAVLGGPGRPPGPTWTLERIMPLLVEYAEATDDLKPTKLRFFEWLDGRHEGDPKHRPSVNTLDTRLKEGRLTWLQWRDSILSTGNVS
jgi:hypothetical protein